MFGKNSSIYKKWESEWERYKAVPENLKIANIGSSCDANNYDYSLWDIEGFNFASAPQDLYYDNQVLEQYGSHLNENAVVIISLSEFALLVDKYETDYHNYKYYGYIDPIRILNYSKIKSLLIKTVPGLLYRRLIKTEIKETVKKIIGWNSNANKKVIGMKEQSERMISGWMKEFDWIDGVAIRDEQYDAINRSWNILLNTFSYCQDHKLQAVVVIPPFNGNLKKLMPENILDDCLWKYIKKIEEMGIKVISFWDKEEFEKDCYYDTPICLNKRGIELFNNAVKKEIFNK